MPWQRMLFRNESVWVLVGEDNRLVLDGDGRAEMKYRENDSKSYRPSPSNLSPLANAGADAAMLGSSGTAGQAAGREGSDARGAARAPRSVASARPRATPAAKPGDPASAPIEIWTDGACSGNPGPMGIGVVVLDGKDRQEVGEFLGVGTNNIAELTAIERALDLASARVGGNRGRRVRIYTDSGYSIGVLDKGWKAKANQDLIARIRRKLAGQAGAIEFVKVPGHAGVPENERCDALARDAITKRPRR